MSVEEIIMNEQWIRLVSVLNSSISSHHSSHLSKDNNKELNYNFTKSNTAVDDDDDDVNCAPVVASPPPPFFFYYKKNRTAVCQSHRLCVWEPKYPLCLDMYKKG